MVTGDVASNGVVSVAVTSGPLVSPLRMLLVEEPLEELLLDELLLNGIVRLLFLGDLIIEFPSQEIVS